MAEISGDPPAELRADHRPGASPSTSVSEEQYRELAQLAGGLAHEVKNPLGTIRLNVQLLGEELASIDSQEARRARHRVEVVLRECDRLAEILDDFLRYAKVSQPRFEWVDLNRMVSEVVEFGRPRIESAGIVVREDLAADLPSLFLDGDLIRQAILNLFLNAEAAMGKGGELILRTRLDGKDVVLDIVDTGPGIPLDRRELVFRPFYSTRRDGSGLGLPTARRIIEAHGGRLLLDSEPGRGTVFHVRLPQAPA